ncbi:MAG: hypothetical protein ABJZ69_07895 [Hyphomicrobiales bacterium]|nr:hypothetical protein [Ruegeria sp. Alg231-54]
MVDYANKHRNTPASKLVMASSKAQEQGPQDAMKAAIRAAFVANP